MQLPEYGCQFSCERISYTKGGTMYGEWLALHQVLADKLCYTFNLIMLGTTTELSMLFMVWGCGYSYT